MRELTERQREILGFIHSFTARHGLPPTVREIGGRFKVTPRAAFDHLRALERKGALQRRPSAGRTSRALTPTAPVGARQFRPVPILGRIAAGSPNLAAEDVEGELPVAPSALAGHGEDVFALRVRGESMIEAHICDGDLVLVRRQESAQANDIVVALLESDAGGDAEATVKRYLRDGAHIVLKPAIGTSGFSARSSDCYVASEDSKGRSYEHPRAHLHADTPSRLARLFFGELHSTHGEGEPASRDRPGRSGAGRGHRMGRRRSASRRMTSPGRSQRAPAGL